MQTVEVTGIRASMAKSLAVKRDAAANVEVITAEDVGKMPDKNLADSLQRLPAWRCVPTTTRRKKCRCAAPTPTCR
jgi:outer membrane receptor for ferrienterochelin and colicin